LRRFADDIDDEHLGAGPRQEDRGGAPIADAVIRRPAAGDDRDLAGEPEIVGMGLRIAHRILASIVGARIIVTVPRRTVRPIWTARLPIGAIRRAAPFSGGATWR